MKRKRNVNINSSTFITCSLHENLGTSGVLFKGYVDYVKTTGRWPDINLVASEF